MVRYIPFLSLLYHVDVRYSLQNLRQRTIDTTGGSGVTGVGASTERNGTNRGGSMAMTGGNGGTMAGGNGTGWFLQPCTMQ